MVEKGYGDFPIYNNIKRQEEEDFEIAFKWNIIFFSFNN